MNKKRVVLSLSIILITVALDQFTKLLITNYVALNTILISFFEGYARIVHVRNLGAIFSAGGDLGSIQRIVVLIILPIAVLVLLFFNLTLSSARFKQVFKINPPLLDIVNKTDVIFLSIIIGGGFGNMVDRIFRKQGVVDFIDLSFFGLFGMDRWPTFNVADIAVTLGAICLAIAHIINHLKNKKTDSEKINNAK